MTRCTSACVVECWTGLVWILQFHQEPSGMETDVVRLPWGWKRNVELKTDFTVMLILLCLQWKKDSISNILRIFYP